MRTMSPCIALKKALEGIILEYFGRPEKTSDDYKNMLHLFLMIGNPIEKKLFNLFSVAIGEFFLKDMKITPVDNKYLLEGQVVKVTQDNEDYYKSLGAIKVTQQNQDYTSWYAIKEVIFDQVHDIEKTLPQDKKAFFIELNTKFLFFPAEIQKKSDNQTITQDIPHKKELENQLNITHVPNIVHNPCTIDMHPESDDLEYKKFTITRENYLLALLEKQQALEKQQKHLVLIPKVNRYHKKKRKQPHCNMF